jgi:hypothetical protein
VDERQAYAAAKALATELSVEFGAARAALSRGGPVLRGVTRTQANEAIFVLSKQGVQSAFLPSDGSAATKRAARPSRRTWLVWLAAALLLGAGAAAVAFWPATAEPHAEAAPPVADGSVLSAEAIAALATPATVSILCGNQVGTGFYISTDTLLTNDHVLCDSPPTIVLADGRRIPGRVETRSAKLDAARVHTERVSVTPLQLGDVMALVSGTDVFSVGASAGLSSTLTRGMVSHPDRALRGLSYIQVDQAINHGNSGGPLLTAQGLVVGIVTLRQDNADGVGFALPVNYLYPTVLGTRPSSWNAAGWEARAAAAEEHEPPTPAGATGAVASLPMLLAAGSLRTILPPGWEPPERTPAEVYALLVMATTSVPPSQTAMHLYSNNQRVCSFTGTPEWRSATTLAPEAREFLQRHTPVPLTSFFIGVVPLRPESPCLAWNHHAVLTMQDAQPGFDRLAINR